jgi:hypothetical protein
MGKTRASRYASEHPKTGRFSGRFGAGTSSLAEFRRWVPKIPQFH